MNVGSPPRTRGARAILDPRQPADGITPAYAGSTVGLVGASARPTDHPRVRGEHASHAIRAAHGCGSPPRTRGALLLRRERLGRLRITPAYAGSTIAHGSPATACRDHPRVRGEHSMSAQLNARLQGSPPRTRGALHRRLWRHWRQGITPAYAGSTLADLRICLQTDGTRVTLGLSTPRSRT